MDDDIFSLLTQRLAQLHLTPTQASREIFKGPNNISKILNGSNTLCDKAFQKLILHLRITENQTLLRQWLKAWFIYRLRDSGVLIWRKTGW